MERYLLCLSPSQGTSALSEPEDPLLRSPNSPTAFYPSFKAPVPLLRTSLVDGHCSPYLCSLPHLGTSSHFMFPSKLFFFLPPFGSVFFAFLIRFTAEILSRVRMSPEELCQLESVTLNDAAWEQRGVPLARLRLGMLTSVGLESRP